MTLALIDDETEAQQDHRKIARFTPAQQRWVLRRQRGLFALLTSNATYTRKFNAFHAEAVERDVRAERAEQERIAAEILAAQRHYFATISRATSYDGPDYRVRFPGQARFIRATKHLYDAALAFGMERSIGTPDEMNVEVLTA